MFMEETKYKGLLDLICHVGIVRPRACLRNDSWRSLLARLWRGLYALPPNGQGRQAPCRGAVCLFSVQRFHALAAHALIPEMDVALRALEPTCST